MRKILVTYTMEATADTAETCIELPISRLQAIHIKETKKDNRPVPLYIMTPIEEAITAIATLQGYRLKNIETVEVID